MSEGGVLVVYQRGRGGTAALAEGARSAQDRVVALTVLALAPQDSSGGALRPAPARASRAVRPAQPPQGRAAAGADRRRGQAARRLSYRAIAQTGSSSPAASASRSIMK